MNKKIYNQPSMKVIELEGNDILAGSNIPSAFNLNDDQVDNYDDHEHEVETRDVWGTQW